MNPKTSRKIKNKKSFNRKIKPEAASSEIKTNPTKVVKTNPTKVVKTNPTKVVKTKPTKVTKTTPTKVVKTKPTKVTKTKPKKRKSKRVELVCILTGKKTLANNTKIKLLLVKYRFKDVEELQKNYISREACMLLKQGFIEAEIRQKFNCTNQNIISFEIIKRYIKQFDYREKMLRKRKRKHVKDLIESESSVKLKANVYEPVKMDLTRADHIQYVTKDVCIRPDIHLDNDYSCNFCPYYEHCLCGSKRWNNKISKQNVKQNKKLK